MRRVNCLLCGVAALLIATSFVASAQADTIIAQWNFSSAGTLLDDSSGNGNGLSNPYGGGVWSAAAPTGSGLTGSVQFGASYPEGIFTTSNLNLSAYRNITISWYQLSQLSNSSYGIVFEDSTNANANPGGFNFATNLQNGTTVVAGAGTSFLSSASGINQDSLTGLSSGPANTTWDKMSLTINLDAATNDAIVQIYKDGVLIGATQTSDNAAAPSSFLNTVFDIGARDVFNTGGGAFFTGNIAGLTISTAPVPEPSTFALLGAGLFGLLAYAWRKRKN